MQIIFSILKLKNLKFPKHVYKTANFWPTDKQGRLSIFCKMFIFK